MSKIKQLREAAGLTQQQLADLTGIHRVAIARYESKDHPGMTVSSACRLAGALKCSLDELLPNDQEGGEHGNDAV